MSSLYHHLAPGFVERLGTGFAFLPRFAEHVAPELVDAVGAIAACAPFRRMETPGGRRMSVAMTNCGTCGWVSGRSGYRYATADPHTGAPWPAMPELFSRLAAEAAERAGFSCFDPDVCLINRYEAGSRLTLHRDSDELDFSAPIVSISLGLPALFQWGGHCRSDGRLQLELRHGDVLVWGGVDRLRYHGVLPLRDGEHPLLGRCRVNLTFRKAG